MCICVRLQDPTEKPSRADPKYLEKARVALLEKLQSGQEVTVRMLQQQKQMFFRRAYKAWHKRVNPKKVRAKKKQRARDKKLLLADLGYEALNIETRSSPPPLENSWPQAHSPPTQLARSLESPSSNSQLARSPATPSSYYDFD